MERKGKLNKREYNFIISVGVALGLRQLAMLLIMPIISIYAKGLSGSTPALVGIAVGIFGLTQSMFQIPYGMASERGRRKHFVLIGLSLLIIGLVIACLAKNIYTLILGRALQGSGGIQAVAYAWIGDSIEKEKRNFAMSIAGIIVGTSAVLGFLVGPLLNKVLSVPMIFLLCSVLVGVTCLYILIFIKDRNNIDLNTVEYDTKDRINNLKNIGKDKSMMAINFMAFFMNYIMISIFFIIPLKIEVFLGVSGLWKVFVPATVIGIMTMEIMVRYSEKGHLKSMMMTAFIACFTSVLMLHFNEEIILFISMIIFMMGYMFLSTLLPSTITKMSGKDSMGIATGVFNTLQFLGTFVGGAMTGLLWGINETYAILFAIIASFIAIIIVYRMEPN